MTNVVDFRETLGAKLIAEIVLAGYTPSTTTGFPVVAEIEAEHYGGGVGLLVQDPRDLPERYFFGLWSRPARRRLVAVIWTENTSRKATANSWVVETSGREDLERVIELTEGLARKFNAKVSSVRLQSDRPSYEVKLSDYDM